MQKKNNDNQIKEFLSKKQKWESTFIIIGIFICIDLITGGILLYRQHIANQGYTEYNLSKRDMEVLVSYYDIYIPEFIESSETFFTDNKYNQKKYAFELVQGVSCEKQIDRINELMFDEGSANHAAILAENYGISSENRLTVDWVLTHPHEAVKIIRADWGIFYDETDAVIYEGVHLFL